MHTVHKIGSRWYVAEAGATHAIAQGYSSKAKAEAAARLYDQRAAEAEVYKAEQRAYRLAAVQAYLETRAARRERDSAQLTLF